MTIPTLERATVADAMHPGVLSCSPDATVSEVARIMTTHRVHGVVVDGISRDAHRSGLVWRLISDLDLVGAAQSAGEELTAGRLAGTPALTVAPENPLRDAARLMREHVVHHLIVASPKDGRPVGVVSTLDIARVVAGGRA